MFHGNYYYFLLFCFNNLLYLCAHKQNRTMTYSGEGKTGWGHFVAFLTVAVWGSTFVFTKMLLLNGLSPAQIFTLRFIIAVGI